MRVDKVSQCIITNGEYGSWSHPTCWAKFGHDGMDGSDASVTSTNVFNALTNDGTKFGCFSDVGGKLYINATYIKSGQVDADLVVAGFGAIGGFEIGGDEDTGYIRRGKESIASLTWQGIYIGTDGISVGGTWNSSIQGYNNIVLDGRTGKLTANYAEISGKITDLLKKVKP